MHRPSPRHWALLSVLTIVLSSTGFAAYGAFSEDDRPSEAERTHADDASAARPGIAPIGLRADAVPDFVHEPPFPLEEGSVPTKSEALDFDARYSRFIAKGTKGLDELATEGHLTGTGTRDDPYILERFYVDGDLTIQSTDRAIVLRGGYVNGQLSLNYIGESVYVHHLYAKDLRVNENVERSGRNTGGLFHDNHFGFVGQIRHFVGEFRDNQVGPVPQGIVRDYLSDTGRASVPEGVVFNFDGFHGAHVHDNRFIGQVDIKLHGHNHGDCLTCPIHDHADPQQLAFDEKAAKRHAEHGHDRENLSMEEAFGFRTRHSVRYHSLLFERNTIEVPSGSAFALRYNDRDHAGDDRTANSEPSRFLEDPHVHYQDITLRENHLAGGPLRLEVFNAKDDRHVVDNEGILRLSENTVEIPYGRSDRRDATTQVGFDLRQGDGIVLHAVGNTVRFTETDDGMPAPTLRSVVTYPPTLIGFRLQTFASGDLLLQGNSVNEGDLGVYAHALTGDVYWDLIDNDFRTKQDWRGERVAHAPGERGGGDA